MEKLVVKGSNEEVLSNGDNQKLKEKLCYGGTDADELLSSWPPIGYTCNFCKRRFKSAQALGGHMNVHRRARAMLRSQTISHISSPTSFTWYPNSITTSTHPFQNDDQQFICINPNNPHWPPYTSHHTFNHSPSILSHLPMITSTSTSSVTITHDNPLSEVACNCKHTSKAKFQLAQLRIREKAKNNCIRAENQLNGLCSRTRIHQEDMASKLRVGTGLFTGKHAADEDIDLELRL